MLNHTLEQHKEAPKRCKALPSAHDPPPIFPKHNGRRSPHLADLNLSHLDGVHEHGHYQAHCSAHHVGHCGFAEAVALHWGCDSLG